MHILHLPIIDCSRPSIGFNTLIGKEQDFDPGFEARGEVGIGGSSRDG